MTRIDSISFIQELTKKVYPLYNTFILACPPDYEVNTVHSNRWLMLLNAGQIDEARQLSREWVKEFANVIYDHNPELQQKIKDTYGDFYLKNNRITARVLIEFY